MRRPASEVLLEKWILIYSENIRSQWPRGIRRGSAVACFLGLWIRIPPGAWMSVCCECYVLSGRGLCVGLITCPEESYRLWCVVMCDLETSWMRRPCPTGGCCAKKKTCSENDAGSIKSHRKKNAVSNVKRICYMWVPLIARDFFLVLFVFLLSSTQ